MAYKPVQGLFVNGRIADATEVLNEFTAISTETDSLANSITTASAKALEDAKKDTDDKLAAFAIDGGTF